MMRPKSEIPTKPNVRRASVPELRIMADPLSVRGDDAAWLLEALAAGDETLIEEILAALTPRVRRWLVGLLGPRADIDDATQDALIGIASAISRYRGDAKLTTFAHRITVRTAYRYFDRADPEELDHALVSDELDPEERAIQREALRRVHRLASKLSAKRRAVFALCAVDGLSAAEAAEVLEIPIATVRTRLHHARAEIGRMAATDPFLGPLVRGEST